ncbi:MAG: 4-hydroxythreonine-4-phosphate dehydrogenase PdxA [Gammaproteobacteria bacterium]|nr:4-hydroxythreonine-4-phosphate dehydrogenase PdxA [Gammaproteobacteria bacterium]
MVTPGEPAGVGPDLCIKLSQKILPYEWIVIADPDLLQQRAKQLNVSIRLSEFDQANPINNDRTNNFANKEIGEIKIIPVKCDLTVTTGELAQENAEYVLKTIEQAVRYCQENKQSGLVTGPVHKGIINQAGYTFSGHTEYIAVLTNSEQPVMMLQTNDLKVALVTTHLPLHSVSKSITHALLERVIKVLHNDLQSRFNIADPKIFVCGLNPHAGEGGHLGREEIEIITPVIIKLKQERINLVGPLPADTLFTPKYLEQADVILAMYHDQGLPVLKYKGFGNAVNVTLGLPIIRTSVDHGTALDLAGTGQINCDSMELAMRTAGDLIKNISKSD